MQLHLEIMNSREVFLAACNQINEGLAEFGFKASQKGACLKKLSKDLFLISYETKFNRYTAQSLIPLAFMLCMTSKEEARLKIKERP